MTLENRTPPRSLMGAGRQHRTPNSGTEAQGGREGLESASTEAWLLQHISSGRSYRGPLRVSGDRLE